METIVSLIRDSVSINSERRALAAQRGYRTETWTYRHLWEFAGRVSTYLRDQGIESGDRIVLKAANSPRWVAAYLGCLRLGAIIVPLDVRSSEEFVSGWRMIACIPDAWVSLTLSSFGLSMDDLRDERACLEGLISEVDSEALSDESCEWVERGEPVVLLGDSGTGKSHLLIGLGMAACQRGLRVRCTTAAQLVNELAEAADERMLSRVVARYGRLDLLCLDELGYLQLDRRGAELLFQVLTEREERASVAVASNAPFSEWGQTFADPRLAAAVVDRLTFRAHIIETGSDSYRLRLTRGGAATT